MRTSYDAVPIGAPLTYFSIRSPCLWSAYAEFAFMDAVFAVSVRSVWLRVACVAFSLLALLQSQRLMASTVQYAPVVTQYAGTGSAGNGASGTATSVALSHPSNMAVDSTGNLYIVDASNLKIRKVDTAGNLTTLSLSGEAPYGPITLNSPQGIAIDASGNIYLADQYATTNPVYGYVYKFNATGSLLAAYGIAQSQQTCISKLANTSASTNTASGCTPSTVLLRSPAGLAMDGSGNLYIADTAYGCVVEINAAGTSLALITANLQEPTGLALDAAGNLYIADYGSSTVKKWSAAGVLSTFAGGASSVCSTGRTDSYGDGCPATEAKFSTMYQSPRAVAADAEGDVYISDPGNNLLREVTPDGYIHAVNGNGSSVCNSKTDSYGNGCPVAMARFNLPAGIAIDSAGNVYVADENDNEVRELTVSNRFAPTAAYTAGSAPANSSTSQSLAFLFTATTTLNASLPYVVLTDGVTGKDFQPQSGNNGSCTAGATYQSGDSCTVNVAFVPESAGRRTGAVVLYDNAATPNVLATAYLTGTGDGAAIAFAPGTAGTIGSAWGAPAAVAIDGAGNLYVADGASSGRLVEVTAGGAQTTLATEASATFTAVAVDGAGDVYYAARNGGSLQEIPSNGGSTRTIGSGLTDPRSIAVDAQGDVYVADGASGKIYRIAADGSTQVSVGAGFSTPDGLAFDADGNLYVGSAGDGTIRKITPQQAQSTVVTGLSAPGRVAPDAAGNLYVVESGGLTELPADGSSTRVLQNSTNAVTGFALESTGSLYVAEAGTTPQIIRLDRADAPTLSFVTTTVGDVSTDSPQAVTLENIGNQTLSADNTNPAVGLTISGNFAQIAGTSGIVDCTADFALAPGAECGVNLQFAPANAGENTGAAVTLTDNALNGGPAQQWIALQGTGQPAVQSVTLTAAVAPGTTLTYGATPNITASLPATVTGIAAADFTATLDGVTALTVSATAQANVFTIAMPVTPLNAGSHTVSIAFSGTSSYAATSTSAVLTISQATLTVTAANATEQYGTALPELSGSLTGVLASDNISVRYGTTASASSPVGAYAITATLQDPDSRLANYAVINTPGTLTIGKATPTINWSTPAAISYGTALSAAQLNASSATPGIFQYSPALGAVLSAGAQTLSVMFLPSDAQDYNAQTATVPLQVNAATQTISFAALPSQLVYGAAPLPLQATASSGLAVALQVSGPATISNGVLTITGAGVVTVTASQAGNANYGAANAAAQVINVAKATPVVMWATPDSIVYGATLSAAQLNGSSATPGTFQYSPAPGAVLSAGAQTLSVTFTPTDSSDYNPQTATVLLQVNKAPLLVTANAVTAGYGQAIPAYTYTLSGFVHGETAAVVSGAPSLTTSPAAPAAVGNYPISAALGSLVASNYDFQFAAGTLTISKAMLTVQVGSASVVYGAALPASYPVQTSGLVAGDALGTALQLQFATTAMPGAAVGTYAVSASVGGAAAGNYSVTVEPGTLQITPLALTATAQAASLVYGQAAPTVQGVLAGVLTQDAGKVAAVYSTTAGSTSPVGTYPVSVQLTGSAAGNYTVQLANSSTAVVTVTPAPLSVVANNVSRGYGVANPVLSGSMTGIVNQDAVAISYATAATADSAVGTYPITAMLSGTALGNYTPAITPGTLTITNAMLTATASNVSRLYGMPNPAFTGAITGMENGDNFAESFSTSATAMSPAGTYAITPQVSGAALADYAVSAVPGVLTIAPAGTSIALSGSSASPGMGSAVSFTAAVHSATSGTPTGTVAFYDGDTLLGMATLDATGTASYSTSFSVLGTHLLSAQYQGDGNFTSSASSSLVETVVTPGYSVTANPASLTLQQGQTGTIQLSLTPVGNYTGMANFSCSGLPEYASCVFAPATVVFDGTNTVQTVTLSIYTAGVNGYALRSAGTAAFGRWLTVVFFWLPSCLLAGFLAWQRHALHRRGRWLVALLVLVAGLAGLSGCGTGTLATPVGNNTVTISASTVETGATQTAAIQITIVR